ncbi:MAG: hypothetical protein ACJ79S_15580 [Gemmatimonadaceae bacterium]
MAAALPPRRPRRRPFGGAGVTRVVALVAAIGQLLVAGAAWLDAVGDRGRILAAHVEESGTSQHRAHVDSTCVFCVAQHLTATPALRSGGGDERPPEPAPAVARGVARPLHGTRATHLSRAPPFEA